MMENKFILLEKCKYMIGLVYTICDTLPEKERYIIIPQICKCAISVPSNIVEGRELKGKNYSKHLRIAKGSLEELRMQLEIIDDIYEIKDKDLNNLCTEISKILYKLINTLPLP